MPDGSTASSPLRIAIKGLVSPIEGLGECLVTQNQNPPF